MPQVRLAVHRLHREAMLGDVPRPLRLGGEALGVARHEADVGVTGAEPPPMLVVPGQRIDAARARERRVAGGRVVHGSEDVVVEHA
jgi:hypothetical protein